MNCHIHRASQADARCFHCNKAICVACTSTTSVEASCKPCAERVALKRRRAALLKGAVFAAVTVSAVVGVVTFAKNYQPSFNYGKYAYEVRRLSDALGQQPCDEGSLSMLLEVMKEAGDIKGIDDKIHTFQTACNKTPWLPWLTTDYGSHTLKVKSLALALAKEPCHRKKTVELLDEMLNAGDHRGVIERADNFLGKCGEMEQVHWKKFAGHKGLSEFDAAIAEASKLIAADPQDRDYPWWRGDAHFMKGDYQAALTDYLKVKELCPKCLVSWALADAAEKAGTPCLALPHLLQTLELQPDLRNYEQVERRAEALKQRPECRAAVGSGAQATR
jgi:tetratricopeptide (TPR) repeat protein